MERKSFSEVYIQQLRERYIGEIFVTLSGIFGIFLEMRGQNETSIEGSIAIVFLIIWISVIFFRNFRLTKVLTQNIVSGYSVILHKSDNKAKDMIRTQQSILEEKNIRLGEIFQYYRILKDDWQYIKLEPIELDKWSNLLTRIQEHFFRYSQRVPIHTQHHLFITGPISIHLGLGYTVGKARSKEWYVYNFNKDTNLYEMIDLKPIGVTRRNFDQLEITEIHRTEGAKQNYTEADLIILTENKSGPSDDELFNPIIKIHLDKDIPTEDFSQIGAGIAQFINSRLASRFDVIHLYLRIPPTLGFIIGWYLDTDIKFMLYTYNYETLNYQQVLTLPDSRLTV